ncbi:MAG: hypothetical protein AAGH19_04250 [Pseudomonadota bacterium]
MRKLIRPMNPLVALLGLALLLLTTSAQAYVGPGLGLGALAVIIGIVVSILIALFAIVWYPLKRRMAAKKKAAEGEGA